MLNPEQAYFARETAALETRYELWHGKVFEIDGFEPAHLQLRGNIAVALGNHLVSQGCRVLSATQRVQVGPNYAYPDVVVACHPDYLDTQPRTLRNPELLVEVASPSTQSHDLMDKLDAYLQLGSLHEYWIADPARIFVIQYHRTAEDWSTHLYTAADTHLHSPYFGLDLSLAGCYALVLDEAAEDTAA